MRAPEDFDCNGKPMFTKLNYNDEFKKIQEYGKKCAVLNILFETGMRENGGDHGYDPKKLNDFNLENFQCLNWNDVSGIAKKW